MPLETLFVSSALDGSICYSGETNVPLRTVRASVDGFDVRDSSSEDSMAVERGVSDKPWATALLSITEQR